MPADFKCLQKTISPVPHNLAHSNIEPLVQEDCLLKPTSALYQHILEITTGDLSSLQQKWLVDIPNMDNEDWEEIWDMALSMPLLVSTRDHLIQFKILHHTYFTPHLTSQA